MPLRLPSRVAARLDGDFRAVRLARRLGRTPAPRRTAVPERPVGAKLELTYACNLRCDFCYTDSPRRTLERATDLSDEAWRAVVEEAIDLGIIEAVVTGGEPLLRRELTLELVERLDAAGVAVSLNTNGWFVDAAVADRLARLPNLTVHLSVDGPTAEIHDAARGVPGSFRRVVRAIDLLVARGVAHSVNHVVTPLGAAGLPGFLELMWVLGVDLVRVTPVVLSGAASRTGGWEVDRAAIARAAREATARHPDFGVLVQTGDVTQIAYQDERAPGTFLVRPNGAVRLDSITPFAFGNVGDGLAACWRRIATDWRHRDILDWAGGMRSSADLAEAAVVPYADDDPEVGAGVRLARARERLRPRLPRRAAASTTPARGLGDVAGARRMAVELALARRWDLAPLRWAGNADGERVARLLAERRFLRLSRTAGRILDALATGTPADAVDALAARHPDTSRRRLEDDVLATVRSLRARGALRPAAVPGPAAAPRELAAAAP